MKEWNIFVTCVIFLLVRNTDCQFIWKRYIINNNKKFIPIHNSATTPACSTASMYNGQCLHKLHKRVAVQWHLAGGVSSDPSAGWTFLNSLVLTPVTQPPHLNIIIVFCDNLLTSKTSTRVNKNVHSIVHITLLTIHMLYGHIHSTQNMNVCKICQFSLNTIYVLNPFSFSFSIHGR